MSNKTATEADPAGAAAPARKRTVAGKAGAAAPAKADAAPRKAPAAKRKPAVANAATAKAPAVKATAVKAAAMGGARPDGARAAPAAPVTPRTRLGPRERERMIVDGAVRFFTETGFAGQTRELSRRLKITQPLLYRYFPSKKALIDRVYKEVFLGNWDSGWEPRLADRSRPLRARLVEFYKDYVKVLFTPEWIRLYMYSGLAGIGFNRRYIARFERLILKRIGVELRHEFGAPRRASAALKPAELEVVWQLHGGIFYYGVRRFIYGTGTHVEPDQMIEGAVDAILAAGRHMFTPAAGNGAAPARKPRAARSVATARHA